MYKKLWERILCVLKALAGKEAKNEMGTENMAQSILR